MALPTFNQLLIYVTVYELHDIVIYLDKTAYEHEYYRHCSDINNTVYAHEYSINNTYRYIYIYN